MQDHLQERDNLKLKPGLIWVEWSPEILVTIIWNALFWQPDWILVCHSVLLHHGAKLDCISAHYKKNWD